MDLFDVAFAVSAEEIEFELRAAQPIPWANYWLNPRQLRGSDFLMRWSQGAWSELRLKEAVNQTTKFYALPYGPSGAAPDHDPREVELYFLRLEAAGLGKLKRPDLLIFPAAERATVEEIVREVASSQGSAAGVDAFVQAVAQLPFASEESIP